MTELNFPNAVTKSDDLFDRETELAEIQQTLESPARRAVVIWGERVIGKTSLLNVTIERLKKVHTAFVLNLPHSYSRAEFAAEILQGICDQVGTELRETGLVNNHGQFRLSTTSQFVNAVKQQLGMQPQAHFVLCLDEFDSLLTKTGSAGAADEILDFVLHLIEKTDLPLRFVFTMTRIRQEILHSYASTFLSCSHLISVGPWSFKQSCEFVGWLLKGRLVLDKESQRLLFESAGGHPYFTKSVVRALLDEQRKEGRDSSIATEHVRSAIETAVHSPEVEFTLVNIVNVHFSPEEKLLLGKIASSQQGLQKEEIGDNSLDMAQDLVKRGYVEIRDQSEYKLRLGIMGNWLK